MSSETWDLVPQRALDQVGFSQSLSPHLRITFRAEGSSEMS